MQLTISTLCPAVLGSLRGAEHAAAGMTNCNHAVKPVQATQVHMQTCSLLYLTAASHSLQKQHKAPVQSRCPPSKSPQLLNESQSAYNTRNSRNSGPLIVLLGSTSRGSASSSSKSLHRARDWCSLMPGSSAGVNITDCLGAGGCCQGELLTWASQPEHPKVNQNLQQDADQGPIAWQQGAGSSAWQIRLQLRGSHLRIDRNLHRALKADLCIAPAALA